MVKRLSMKSIKNLDERLLDISAQAIHLKANHLPWQISFFSSWISLNTVSNSEFIWIKDMYFWDSNIFTFVTLIIPLYSLKSVFSSFSCYLNRIATPSSGEITMSNKSRARGTESENWKWFHPAMIYFKKKYGRIFEDEWL